MSGSLVSLEFGELEDLLRPAIDQHVQALVAGPSGDGPAIDAEAMMTTLYRLLCASGMTDGAALGGVAGLGAQLPQVDADLVAVQAEVDAILQRLAERRKAVPAAMAAAMQSQLEQLRPLMALPAADADASAAPESNATAEAEGAASEDAACAAQLHEELSGALGRLPTLRARLEAAAERLSRNLAAVEAGQGRASPKTVERVMLNRTNMQAGAGGQEEGLSPAALTKRRLAADFA